jgi:hypothetical protein
MRDPVVAADGHTYERAGAERWFARHGAVSMVTGAPLPHANLVPNQARLPSPLPRPSADFTTRPNVRPHRVLEAVCSWLLVKRRFRGNNDRGNKVFHTGSLKPLYLVKY